MAGKNIKVSTTRLKNDAQKVNSCMNNISKAMDNINADVAVLDRMWEGLAKESFDKSFSSDQKKVASIIKEIKAMYSFQMAAVTAYENCEKQIENLTSGLKL